jgi:hypothetical protein
MLDFKKKKKQVVLQLVIMLALHHLQKRAPVKETIRCYQQPGWSKIGAVNAMATDMKMQLQVENTGDGGRWI